MNGNLDDYFAEELEEEEELPEEFPPYILWNLILTDLSYSKLKWQSEANCFDLPHGAMYPPRAIKQQKAANSVCVSCPVQHDCLYFALVSRETNGVWGGTTEEQRIELFDEIAKTEFRNYRMAWSDDHGNFLWEVAGKYVQDFEEIHTKKTAAQAQV